MVHYPTRRARLLAWLPAPCSCGAPRFDRCPDAVADAQAGNLAPRGGAYDHTTGTLQRITAGLHDNRGGWWSA